MELRQLTTNHERKLFGECLGKARATRGIGFRETGGSHLGKAHLMFGDVFAIFENEGEPPERMVGGFIMHNLASLPQSYGKPDLSYLPPRAVLEGSELWSLSLGVGRVAGRAAAAVAGLVQAKAILVYPMLTPVDLTQRYVPFNFGNACPPIRWPYAETIDGDEIWAQPMILEGEKLEEYIAWGLAFVIQADRGRPVFQLNDPQHRQIPSNLHARERNGTTPAQ